MIKVCHITSVHSRYDVRIFHKECYSLREAGFDVYQIVADGKGDEIKEGIKILDVGNRKSKLKRVILSTKDLYKKAKSLKADIYHFHDPELIWVGLMLKNAKTEVIYDIHEDYYKQIFLKHGFTYPIKWIIAKTYRLMEVSIFHYYSALIVPQPIMLKKYNSCNKNVRSICNFVNTPVSSTVSLNLEKRYIYHGGGLSEERGLVNMIKAMEFVRSDINLVIAGPISETLLTQVKNLKGWSKVKYLGLLTYKESILYYKNSEIGLILYNNVGQYYLSYSIKLFEYMSYGKPVIMPDFGEWINFNVENDCGLNVDVKDPVAVAKNIDILMENEVLKYQLGSNAKESIIKKYNWPSEANKLIRLYHYLCKCENTD
jgi:glycosyltransferase involved in cell wall biosynthesis